MSGREEISKMMLTFVSLLVLVVLVLVLVMVLSVLSSVSLCVSSLSSDDNENFADDDNFDDVHWIWNQHPLRFFIGMNFHQNSENI